MAHWVPSARVHLLPAPSDDTARAGETVIGRVSLAGGARRGKAKCKSPDANLFFLTSVAGKVVANERGECRTYESCKPTGAATKAFRVFIRSEAGKHAFDTFRSSAESNMGVNTSVGIPAAARRSLASVLEERALRAYETVAAEIPLPAAVETALAAGLSNATLSIEEAGKYRRAYWADDPALFTFVVDVYIGRRGKPSVRRYQVRYMPLLKPNLHEIKKGINKVAKATYIPKNRVVEAGVVCASTMGMGVRRKASPRRREDDGSPRRSPRRKRARIE